MDIPSNTNINGKYVLNASQYGKMKGCGMVYPLTANMSNASYGLEPVYVIKKQDFAVNHNNAISGEGGLGSGESLEKRFPNASADELKRRRYAQIKNAQRKYRAKPDKRAEYNAYMRDLYYTMAKEKKFIDGKPSSRFGEITPQNQAVFDTYSTPQGWYDYRLKKARVANKLYREKKKAEKIMTNLDKEIEKELKEKFKKENKNKRGRPSKKEVKKVFDPDSSWYKENFEALKLAKQKELSETGTIMPYKLRQKKTQPEYPLGTYKINKDGVNELIEALDDKKVDDRKEYNVDAKAFKDKRAKPKAPPVKSEKKKEASPFTPTEPVKKEEKPLFTYRGVKKTLSELDANEKRAYDYITERNKGQSMTIDYSKIPAIVEIQTGNKKYYDKPFAPKENNITMTISEK
jgi:hypothetical protein